MLRGSQEVQEMPWDLKVRLMAEATRLGLSGKAKRRFVNDGIRRYHERRAEQRRYGRPVPDKPWWNADEEPHP